MFSDNYIVSDKYSLVTEEYISTRETMPWFYTSLYDETYLPVLDKSVADKLNLFFRYRYLHSSEALRDDLKNLIIEHNNGEIISFEILNMMNYSTLTASISYWKHFISSIDCLEANACKQKIDKMTDETDELVTRIVNLQYKPDASLSGISIFDSSYNLSEYQNDGLSLINDLCKNNSGDLKGVVTIHPDSETIKFKIMLNYPGVSLEFYRDPKDKSGDASFSKNMVVVNKNKTYRDAYISLLLDNGLITESNVEYMQSIFSENSKFDIEFIIDADGTISDIHLINFRIYEFSDLTAS